MVGEHRGLVIAKFLDALDTATRNNDTAYLDNLLGFDEQTLQTAAATSVRATDGTKNKKPQEKRQGNVSTGDSLPSKRKATPTGSSDRSDEDHHAPKKRRKHRIDTPSDYDTDAEISDICAVLLDTVDSLRDATRRLSRLSTRRARHPRPRPATTTLQSQSGNMLESRFQALRAANSASMAPSHEEQRPILGPGPRTQPELDLGSQPLPRGPPIQPFMRPDQTMQPSVPSALAQAVPQPPTSAQPDEPVSQELLEKIQTYVLEQMAAMAAAKEKEKEDGDQGD